VTIPGGDPNIGRAEIEVRGNTSHFPSDTKRGVEEALQEAEPTLKKGGEEWGDEVSKSFSTRLKSKVHGIVDEFVREVNKTKITEKVKVDEDVDHNSIKNAVRNIARDLEQEVTSGGGGGVFKFFGQAISDAIGSGFNVSGKSPLIAFLVPLFGAIAALVVGAIQAVNGLAAALLTIPNILGAIGLQALTLMLIFKDVGPAIGAALAATNAKELQAALKDLDPYVRNFVQELVYIRNEFRDITKYLDIQFFKNLGNTLLDIFDYNRYTLFTGLFNLAGELGTYFATIGKAFETPEFAKFLYDLFREIDVFLATNGPTLQKFLTQVFIFLDSLMGATRDVGGVFNDFLEVFGDWLEETAKSKDFQDWLKELPTLLTDAGRLLGVLADLLITLFNSIDKAGGQEFVDQLVFMIALLTQFFSSDLGIQALKALLIIILVLTAAFVDLVIAIGAVLGGIQELGNWLNDVAGPAIGKFFSNLGHAIAEGLSPKPITDFLDNIKNTFETLGKNAFAWGKNFLKSFINGILDQVPGVAAAAKAAVAAAAQFFPHSPAKVGPFSGAGAPEESGRAVMRDFAKGLMDQGRQAVGDVNTAMSNLSFGPGAVIANFYGSNPTPQQAQTLGTALGTGISDQLAARNARLAVRTM
jgi:hypothetical protein